MPPNHQPQVLNHAFHGWRMVWALSVSTTVAYGVLYYSFAVFVQPMERELDWNRAQTSLAFSLAMLVAGLIAPVLGRVLDRRGSREVMSLGALLASALLLVWAQTSSLGLLYLTWLLLGVSAAATFYDPAFTAIAVWFKRHRARAMLAITLVAGLASTIFVPLDTWLLAQLGWRGAVRVLAAVMLLTAPLLWFTLRRHPADLGQSADGLPLEPDAPLNEFAPAQSHLRWWSSRAFWSVALAFALARTAVAVLSAHLVPLLIERGYTRALAATIAAAVGLLQLVGRVFISAATSRAGLVWLAAATFFGHGLGILALALNAAPGVWVFLALYGTTNGAITLARAALLAEVFPPAMYGRINGAVSLIVALSGAAMPWLAGVLHTRTGNYDLTLWILVSLLLLASLIVLGVRGAQGTGSAPHS